MNAQNKIAWPADKVERRPITDLVAHARNSRTHSKAQIDQIARSIKEWGWTVPVLVDEEGTIIAGHGRVLAAEKMKLSEVPVMVAEGWSDAQKRAYLIADNKLTENAGWDNAILAEEFATLRDLGFDTDATGFDVEDIDSLLGDLDDDSTHKPSSLTDDFGVAPFTVLNAREGWWQDRKRSWIALGVRSELGRGEARTSGQDLMRGEHVVGSKGKTNGGVLMPSHTSGDPSFYAKKRHAEKELGKKLSTEEFLRDHYVPDTAPTASGTSIFDPVLCELVYRWFSAPGWSVLDPFAGGSVRGIVANRLGRAYTGIELRGEQVEENRDQGRTICPDNEPEWITGDATKLDESVGDREFDLIFSCPPYADLEVYSDDPADLSNMPYPKFLEMYAKAIALAVDRLKKDRFACFVVGEVRDKGKGGFYRSFVPDTIAAFENAGARFYNEAILVTAIGSLPIRLRRQFESGRKLGKTHQNVLMFCKGDPAKTTKALGACEFGDPAQSPFAKDEAAEL